MSCGPVTEDLTAQNMTERDGSDTGSDASSVAGQDHDAESTTADTDSESIHDDVIPQEYLEYATFMRQQFRASEPLYLWRTGSAFRSLARTPRIVARIFHFAMQAHGNRIIMPRATGWSVDCGILPAVLALNHALYHRYRHTLYRDNEFVVDNYGSGLQYLSQAMGADICPPGCNPHPTIKSIHLFVGCRDFDWQGVRRAEMFMQALQDMPRPITVQRLRLDLGGFCFLWNKELAHFAELLKEKFVATTFEFCGSDYHWEWDMRVVPKALGMKLQPSVINFRHHSDQDQVLGWFSSLYERAQNENERLGLDGQGNEIEVRDGKYYFETRQNFFLGKLTNAS